MMKSVFSGIMLLLTAISVSAAELPKSATIETVQKRGELRVGIVLQVPISYQDPRSGQLTGFALTIAREGANRLGVPKVTFIQTSWDGAVAGLQANKYDIMAAGLVETEERKAAIDFVTVYETGLCFLVQKSNTKLNTLDDIKDPNVRVATMMGSGAEQVVKKYFPMVKLESVPTVGGAGAPVELVLSGRADASQVDHWVGEAWAKRYCELKVVPPDCYKAVPYGLPVGWGVNRGDPGWREFWQKVVTDYKQLMLDERERYSAFEYLFPNEKAPVCK